MLDRFSLQWDCDLSDGGCNPILMSTVFALLFYPASISQKILGVLQQMSKKDKIKTSGQRTKDGKQKIKGGEKKINQQLLTEKSNQNQE